ncbi:MAG: purine-nucleoside phosphorylase [Treponema sp.]|nr:purine-nucleoside phosphorylase [Treponema sp.]
MIPTPHNAAKLGDIARTVLMPGDPLRAEFIAEHFLQEPVQFNSIRGMLGFTGQYKGVTVSVMGSGMGMPSIGIYSYELLSFYGVENIIRVGTAGGIHRDLKLKDIVFAIGASTNSNYASQYNLQGTFAPVADYSLLRTAVDIAEREGFRYMVGNILSSDTFYSDAEDTMDWAKMGVLAVEMETAALYMNAARLCKKALGLFTISDSLITGEITSSEERQNSFTDMMKVALETAHRIG